jgi:hypothetical protein
VHFETSYVNSLFKNVSKWLVKELRKLRSVEGFSIKNSVKLCEKLKDVTVNQHEVLASFDVVSLFPSFPLDLASEQKYISQYRQQMHGKYVLSIPREFLQTFKRIEHG